MATTLRRIEASLTLQRSPMSNADDFFSHKKQTDPAKYKDLTDRYPDSDKDQIYWDASVDSLVDESVWKKRQRIGKSGGVPKNKKRKFNKEEWSDYRKHKGEYLRQWQEDFAKAKELADQGM